MAKIHFLSKCFSSHFSDDWKILFCQTYFYLVTKDHSRCPSPLSALFSLPLYKLSRTVHPAVGLWCDEGVIFKHGVILIFRDSFLSTMNIFEDSLSRSLWIAANLPAEQPFLSAGTHARPYMKACGLILLQMCPKCYNTWSNCITCN